MANQVTTSKRLRNNIIVTKIEILKQSNLEEIHANMTQQTIQSCLLAPCLPCGVSLMETLVDLLRGLQTHSQCLF